MNSATQGHRPRATADWPAESIDPWREPWVADWPWRPATAREDEAYDREQKAALHRNGVADADGNPL